MVANSRYALGQPVGVSGAGVFYEHGTVDVACDVCGSAGGGGGNYSDCFIFAKVEIIAENRIAFVIVIDLLYVRPLRMSVTHLDESQRFDLFERLLIHQGYIEE